MDLTNQETPKGIGLAIVNDVYLRYFTTNANLDGIKRLPLHQKLLLCAAWLFKEHEGSNQNFTVSTVSPLLV